MGARLLSPYQNRCASIDIQRIGVQRTNVNEPTAAPEEAVGSRHWARGLTHRPTA
jgi:hypothetical protein